MKGKAGMSRKCGTHRSEMNCCGSYSTRLRASCSLARSAALSLALGRLAIHLRLVRQQQVLVALLGVDLLSVFSHQDLPTEREKDSGVAVDIGVAQERLRLKVELVESSRCSRIGCVDVNVIQ